MRRSFTHQCEAPTEKRAVEEMEPGNIYKHKNFTKSALCVGV